MHVMSGWGDRAFGRSDLLALRGLSIYDYRRRFDVVAVYDLP